MSSNKPNGFYMFMLSRQKEMRRKTNRAPSMAEMPNHCQGAWNALPEAEKTRYNNMAKKERSKQQNGEQGYGRMDCHRQVIADRVDPAKADKRRRELEKKVLLNSWEGQNLNDIVFHILDFRVMYDSVIENQHFPLEIGMSSFTFNRGVINYMHRFINPGEVPQGNRSAAVEHANATHQIPLGFEHADGNLEALTDHMKDFVKSNSTGHGLPPVFCLKVERRQVENCLDFIYRKSYVPEEERFDNKLYCLEDLVYCIFEFIGKAQPPESQVVDGMFRNNTWDHTSSIKCFYHESLDCSHCSLSIARRYCFGMFNFLSGVLGFDLTAKHMPDDLEANFTITESTGFGRASVYDNGDDRRNRSRQASSESSRFGAYNIRSNPPSQRENAWQPQRETQNAWQPQRESQNAWQPQRENAWQSQRETRNAWQPPAVKPVIATVSDEESEEEEEEEAVPRQPEQSLGRLRLPRSLAQVQTQVGGMSVKDEDDGSTPPSGAGATAAPGSAARPGGMMPGSVPAVPPVGAWRGNGMPGSVPAAPPAGAWRGAGGSAPIRPMGRGSAPPVMGRGSAPPGMVRPMGRAAPSPVMPAPPPGFERQRPQMMAAATPPPPPTPQSQIMNERDFPALGGGARGRGRGMGRGRSTLPSQNQ